MPSPGAVHCDSGDESDGFLAEQSAAGDPSPTALPHAEFTHRVLTAFAFDNCDMLFWRVDDPDKSPTFFALVNDVFWWGTADLEPIEPADLPTLDGTIFDLDQLGYREYLAELYAARKRGTRPQGAYYHGLPAAVSELFDRCGPERTVDITNPKPCTPTAHS